MAVASLLIIAIGIILVGIGIYLSLYEWKKEQERIERERAGKDGVVTDQAGALGEAFDGLTKLAEALRHHRLGMQLIIVGIALITIGGIFGGVGGLLNNCG